MRGKFLKSFVKVVKFKMLLLLLVLLHNSLGKNFKDWLMLFKLQNEERVLIVLVCKEAYNSTT